MLKMYFPFRGPVSEEEGNKFVNHRLRRLVENYILHEYIYNYESEEPVKKLILPRTERVKNDTPLNEIINVSRLRKSRHFAKWLEEDYFDVFPNNTSAKEAVSTLFGLYDILTAEKEYEPNWMMKYLLAQLIGGYISQCKDCPDIYHYVHYMGRIARDKMIAELTESYEEELKEWEINKGDPDDKPFTPEEMMVYWEDIREYEDWIFEDLDFDMLDITSVDELKQTGVYDYTGMDYEGDTKKLYEDLKNGCAGQAPMPDDSPNGAELLYAKYKDMPPQEMIDEFNKDVLNKWPEDRFPQDPDLGQLEHIGVLFLMACDKRKGYATEKKYAQEQIIKRLERLSAKELHEKYPLCLKTPENERLFKNDIKRHQSAFIANIKEGLADYDYLYDGTPEEHFRYHLPFTYNTCKNLEKAEANLRMATGMAIVSTARLKSKGYSVEQMKEILECVNEGLCTILSSISGNILADGVDASTTEKFLLYEYFNNDDDLKAPTNSVRDRLKEFKERNN